jgi:hypothetical protein
MTRGFWLSACRPIHLKPTCEISTFLLTNGSSLSTNHGDKSVPWIWGSIVTRLNSLEGGQNCK